MKRASYREGISWIAQNDEPEEMDAERISGFISVGLLADLFDKDQARVAADILRVRTKEAEAQAKRDRERESMKAELEYVRQQKEEAP